VSYRPPGVATVLIAAGAPGTSTDPRGGLPPPPSASFRPTHMSIGSPVSPASYTQINRSAGPDRQVTSIESQDEADEADAKWGPEVQKIYDEFLADERMYVQEGLWDRFPLNSRLFIGEQINLAFHKSRKLTCSNRQSPKRESDKTRLVPCVPPLRKDCTGID
jgi:nuclear polyadenylated RNA-binding protein 3